MSFNLPSVRRIKQSKEFEQAFHHKSLTNKWFNIYFVKSNHELARLGMVISKKTMPKSVSRNYAKRLIREAFRLNLFKLPALDFIVRSRRNLTKGTSTEAKEALLQLMFSAKIL